MSEPRLVKYAGPSGRATPFEMAGLGANPRAAYAEWHSGEKYTCPTSGSMRSRSVRPIAYRLSPDVDMAWHPSDGTTGPRGGRDDQRGDRGGAGRGAAGRPVRVQRAERSGQPGPERMGLLRADPLVVR